MQPWIESWHEAARTSAGWFWMALWAFALGYLLSSLIQVVVSRERMRAAMGDDGARSMALGTLFGFLSSSCSFAALSTTRALFARGAGLSASLAFLLASTNLVIELGVVIALFLSWQFVVGEYVGGLLLIGFAWVFVRVTRPEKLVAAARQRMADSGVDDGDGAGSAWRATLTSVAGWTRIGRQYLMEWQMVWKEVLVGFTVAGIIAAFVPDGVFQTLFPGTGAGSQAELSFWQVLVQTLVGPVAAFLTFIGSMGNVPLAGVLFGHGVSFAGVMAFLFSDMVVLPVLRINARYYGWPLALYMLGLLLSGLVLVSLAMHYGLLALDLLPDDVDGPAATARAGPFALDTGFVLNVLALLVSATLVVLVRRAGPDEQGDDSCEMHGGDEGNSGDEDHGDEHEHGGGNEHEHEHHEHADSSATGERVLRGLALLAGLWLVLGLFLAPWLG